MQLCYQTNAFSRVIKMSPSLLLPSPITLIGVHVVNRPQYLHLGFHIQFEQVIYHLDWLANTITEISSKWNDFPLLRYMVYHLCSSVIITCLKTNTFSPSCLYSLKMVQIWKISWTLLIILCKVQHQFKYSLLAQLAYTLWW